MQLERPQPIKNHPNASLAATGGSIGILVVYIVGIFGLTMDNEVAGAIVTVTSSTILVLGRRGFKGLWHIIMNGSEALSGD